MKVIRVFILYIKKKLFVLRYAFLLLFCFVLLFTDLKGNKSFDKVKQTIYFHSVSFSNFVFYPVMKIIDYASFVKDISILKLNQYTDLRNNKNQDSVSVFDRSIFFLLKNENILLKKQLNFINNYSIHRNHGYQNFSYITTQSLGGVYNFSSHSFIIPIGSNNGVKKNNIVIDSNGLVGKITKVEKNTSHVLCIDDILFRIPVVVGGNHVQAILSGYGKGNNLKLLYVDNTHIKNGDLVLTSGVFDESPSDIIVGVVDQNLFVKPFIDFKDIGLLSAYIVNHSDDLEDD